MVEETVYNRLREEKSPYLQQHADNPVDWYPWGEEAFAEAKNKDKPVFLSIGYSTCHWCHVMAKESFEDEEVAEVINENFVPVKVDREERPDIDNIYMRVCQLMTGHGGWPLTILLTPNKEPFYAATYLPKRGYGSRPGLMELLKEVSRLWGEDRENLLTSAEKITARLQEGGRAVFGEKDGLDEGVFDRVFEQLVDEYDGENGGFGSAPKFPVSHRLLFLAYEYSKQSGNSLEKKEGRSSKAVEPLKMLKKTLAAWRCGGIYDQLGYGFHRYSTDEKWLVPHFEKMLYDQALLTKCYLAAYQITGEKVYAEVVKEILNYVEQNMLSPEGGFYSAEDADSEGIEGKFYFWEKEEIEDHLEAGEAELFIDTFNIKPRGNFRDEATGRQEGKNILHLSDINDRKREDLLDICNRLFHVREQRVHPHRDKKILTDWNGLMITALARAGDILAEEKYIELAEGLVSFIQDNMFDPEGKLLHRYGDNEAGIRAYLVDYAFVIQGLIELYQATFDTSYLRLALNLQKQLNEHFWDEREGGFFFSPDYGEELLARDKPVYDGALPSGNSVALWNLVRLFHITGEVKYRNMAQEMAGTFGGEINHAPTGYLQFLNSYRDLVDSFYSIVIVGREGGEEVEQIKEVLRNNYLPNKVVLFRSVKENGGQGELEQISEYTADFEMKNGETTIYVCNNLNCELPTTKKSIMAEYLGFENN